jgi:hypothetical protein
MKQLSQRLYTLISKAVNIEGTFNPDEILYLFEEDLTSKEYAVVVPFLKWCHENNKGFGKSNYNERFQEYLSS